MCVCERERERVCVCERERGREREIIMRQFKSMRGPDGTRKKMEKHILRQKVTCNSTCERSKKEKLRSRKIEKRESNDERERES